MGVEEVGEVLHEQVAEFLGEEEVERGCAGADGEGEAGGGGESVGGARGGGEDFGENCEGVGELAWMDGWGFSVVFILLFCFFKGG